MVVLSRKVLPDLPNVAVVEAVVDLSRLSMVKVSIFCRS